MSRVLTRNSLGRGVSAPLANDTRVPNTRCASIQLPVGRCQSESDRGYKGRETRQSFVWLHSSTVYSKIHRTRDQRNDRNIRPLHGNRVRCTYRWIFMLEIRRSSDA